MTCMSVIGKIVEMLPPGLCGVGVPAEWIWGTRG